MRISILSILILLCTALSLFGQMPVEISINGYAIGHTRADCPAMSAGNARLSSTTEGDQLTNVDSISLCFGNGVFVSHQGDYNVSEDPVGTTPAGVFYAVFSSQPSSTDVLTETELANLPDIVSHEGNLIFARADANGNMTIINDGSFLAAAGLTAPVKLWFAPVTVHNINATQPQDFFENTDACVHMNSSSAFAVTYLTALDFTVNQSTSTTGTITATGGSPELDGSLYNVTLTNLSTQITTPLTSNGNRVFDYTLPSADDAYRVTISDGQGCSMSRIITFRSGPPLEVLIPDTTVGQGEMICVPLKVNEFMGIGTFSFALKWNPAVLEFASFSFSNPALEVGSNRVSSNTDFSDQGVVIFLWIDNNVQGADIADGEILLDVCFNAIGQTGERTQVFLDSHGPTSIDFGDLNNSVGFTTYPGSVTIVPSDSLDFSYMACGSSTFNLDIQMFGGRGPYSYNLTGAGSASGTDEMDQFNINNLAAGAYSLTVTDADGAQVQKNINILDNSSNYSIGIQPNTCGNQSPNGYAYITNPPSTPYQIEWTYNNQTFYNVDTLHNIAGGDVSVTITDQNQCQSQTRTVTVPNQGIQATATVTQQPSCSGNPGDVLIDISGGTPNYTVNYNGGNLTTNTSSITMDIYGTSANYRISDANNCTINVPVTTTVEGAEVFTLNSGTVTDINCENFDEDAGGIRGQFRGNVTNGSTTSNNFHSAELYFADGTPVNGTKFIPNPLTGSLMARYLDPGEYEWRISGQCAGSDTTFAFTIEDLTSTPPSVDPVITPIGCDSSNALGAISLTVFPENRGYSYMWSTGDSTSSITNVDTGRYTVTVTDTLSKCSQHEEFTLQSGVTLSKIETTLPCDADTMVNVGVAIRDVYQGIQWDSGENTEIISVRTPGYYPFTITPADAACSPYRDSIYIASQTGGIRITGLNPVLVNSCSNPEAIMVAYTSEPTDSLGFSWDNGPVTMALNDYRFYDDEVHNLKVYKDNCIAVDTNFSFTFNNIIHIEPTVYNIDCHGNDNGEITVFAEGGGSNNFRYEFNNSGRQDFVGTYTGLAPGNYTVRVIDQTPPSASPCPDVNLTFTIAEPEPFSVAVDTTQVTQPSCDGDSDGMIMLTTTGGNPGTMDIRYNFSGGAGRTNELTIDSLRASNYQIRVEDSLGCIATTQYLLAEPDPVNFTIPPIAEPACAGYTTTITIPNATGGTGMNYQYSVDGGVPVPLGDPLDILAGTHEITVFDGNLCSVTNDVTIREPAPIVVGFNQPDTIQVSLGEGTNIAAQINGENPITDYIWTPAPADSLSEDNTLSFTAVDNVTIGLEVMDSRGCIGSNEIFVLVRKKRDVGIPNAFTPNGDGHNDLLTIIPGPAVRTIKNFQIYDRWGNLIWEESDISPAQAQITGWDGTASGTPAMFDVYVALVKVEYIDGEVIQRITDVTLMK